MCNVEEDIEELSSITSKKFDKGFKNYRSFSKCKKCGENSILLLQKKDAFCKVCFFEYCDHKFRSTIGKTKKIKHGDKVLLACSGGRKSSALLHMTKQTLDSASAKQISFIPGILFIDESVVMNEEKHQTFEICKDLENYGYPVLLSSLEMVYKLDDDSICFWNSDAINAPSDLPACLDSQCKIRNCMSDLPLTSKLDFIKHLRLLLMTEIAYKAGYQYLFVGDTACTLAANLLTNISLGRGSQISSDTNFYDTRYKVAVCRPIREFLNKEIALYNHLHNCKYIVMPDLLTKTDAKSSIQRLTESFITNLQEDFPATVFTIFRTGGKLSKLNTSLETSNCFLCKSRLDNAYPDPCSALEALKLSRKLSKIELNNVEVASDENSASSDSMYNSETMENMNIFQYLCHGCSIPFRYNKKNLNFFPNVETNLVKMKRQKMKEDIQDFLINNDDTS